MTTERTATVKVAEVVDLLAEALHWAPWFQLADQHKGGDYPEAACEREATRMWVQIEKRLSRP